MTYLPSVRVRLTIIGCFLLLVYAEMAWMSRSFVYGQGHDQRPIIEFLALYASAFVLYVLALCLLPALDTTNEIPPVPPLSKGGTQTPPFAKGAARSARGFGRVSVGIKIFSNSNDLILILGFACLFRVLLLHSNPI